MHLKKMQFGICNLKKWNSKGAIWKKSFKTAIWFTIQKMQFKKCDSKYVIKKIQFEKCNMENKILKMQLVYTIQKMEFKNPIRKMQFGICNFKNGISKMPFRKKFKTAIWICDSKNAIYKMRFEICNQKNAILKIQRRIKNFKSKIWKMQFKKCELENILKMQFRKCNLNMWLHCTFFYSLYSLTYRKDNQYKIRHSSISCCVQIYALSSY